MATKKPPAWTKRVRILIDPGPPELADSLPAEYVPQEPRQRRRSPRVEQRFAAEEAELEELLKRVLKRRDPTSSGAVGLLVREVGRRGYSGRLAGMEKKQIGRVLDRVMLKRERTQGGG